MNHFWPICVASHLFLLSLAHAATAAEVVPYTLEQAGRVSAAVYDAEGPVAGLEQVDEKGLNMMFHRTSGCCLLYLKGKYHL